MEKLPNVITSKKSSSTRMKIEPFPGTLTKQPVPSGRGYGGKVMKWVLTEDQREWLCKYFPEVENNRLMKMSGMSHSTLHRMARELGLTKSENGLRGIKKRQAAHVKRLCERNGYYDSLRGHRPSEESIRGTKQMWKEIRAGKRMTPYMILKQKSPRKYRQMLQRSAAERKETMRKDIWRLNVGLPPKTRLKCVVLFKYTRSQVAHRYNALKRGYIVMADCSERSGERYNIYYNKDTSRSPVFEQNLLNDGFTIKEWRD